MECVLGIAYEVGSVKIEKHHGDTANVDRMRRSAVSYQNVEIHLSV